MTPTREGPLAGRVVLLTRPAGAGRLAARLEELGAEVVMRPTIALVAPTDPGPARRAVENLESYDWLLFTSPQGVGFFTRQLAASGRDPGAIAARIAAIGPATARALRGSRGLAVELVAGDSRSEGFLEALLPRLAPGARALLVRPEAARPLLAAELRGAGVALDDVAFYRNEASPQAAAAASEILQGRFDVVVFTSPSTLERLLEAAGGERADLVAALARTRIVAIGPVTAGAVRSAALGVAAVARSPLTDGIVDAIRSLFPAGTVVPSARSTERRLIETGKLRRTPLHDVHVSSGARMVEFSGWHMPVQYTSVIDEHNAVRQRAGVFDVSHMGQAEVTGPQALAFLQRVTCNDVGRLAPGRAQYNALTTAAGTFVDDLLVYPLAENDYLLVLNAGNTAKDLAWLEEHRRAFDVEVADRSAVWALIAIQGPLALATLEPLVRQPIAQMKYYGFARADVDGVPSLVSRTGYTGEDGFEIYAPSEAAPRVWSALMAGGQSHGVVPAGLGARDTLRLEAKMALYGNDIDDTTTVLEADLGWIVKLDKGDFVGREVLARQAAQGVERKLVGFEMAGRGIPRHGHTALSAGREVGRVTSGTFAPYLKKAIGLCYLPVELTEIGTGFDVDVRGRHERAVVVPTPFYRRPRTL